MNEHQKAKNKIQKIREKILKTHTKENFEKLYLEVLKKE